MSAYRFLTNHAQETIGDYCEFQNQFIGLKFARWKTFYIHVCFYFTVELLAFPMGMVILDDFFICHSGVCPPCIDFNIGWKKELTIFINCPLYYLIPCSDCDSFFLSIRCVVADWFPVTSGIYCFSFTGSCDILGVCLCHLKPVILTFTAQIPFYNKVAAAFQKNTNVFGRVVSRIQPDKQRFICYLPAQGNCFPKECRSIALTVLFSLPQLCILPDNLLFRYMP